MEDFNDINRERSNKITSVYFFVLTGLFVAVVSIFMYLARRDQPEFYKEYSSYLWGAMVALTTPLLLRCVLDWIKNIEAWDNIINAGSKSITTSNIVFFVTTSWVLILAQGATLIFGLVRMKQSKEIKKNKIEIKKSISSSKLVAT